MQVGEAFITVRPDTSKFGPEMTRDVEASGRQAASGLGAALAGGAVVAGLTKVIGSASDLNEAMNKTRATFGDASGSVEAFASTSADSFGISEAAALDLAGGLGAMLIPLGTSQQEAAGMSTTLLELAADMGSFNNQDPTEMLDRLRAGLAGEAEPLRQFGVSINEARVQQFAWENGIAEAGATLTDQQKIMARYGLILQDTAVQQGDFANTADSAANAQRRAAATAEDAAASTGSNFLPVYEQGVAVVQKFAAAFGALPGPLQTAAVLLGGFVALKGPMGGAFSAIGESIRVMALRMREAGGGMAGLRSAISPGALGVGAAVVGFGLVAQAMADTSRRAQEAEDRVKALADAFSEGGEAAAGDTLLTQISDQVPEAVDALNEAGVSAVDLVSAAAEGGGALEELVRRVGDVGNLSSLSTIELGRLAEATRQAASSSAEMGEATDANAEAAAEGASSIQEEADALTEVADSADAAKESLDALFGVQMSMDEASTNVQQTTDDLSRSIRENGHQWDENTQKGRDNMAAARDAAAAIREMTVAHRSAGGTMQEVTGRSRMLEGGLRAQLRAAGLTKGQIDSLISTYARVPRRVLSEISQIGAEAVISDLQRISAEAQRAAAAVRQISGSLAGGGSYGGARAVGGPVESGTSYLVGERGPEMFTPGASGAITPAASGTPTAGGWGGVTVVVEGNVIGDVDRFADEIAFRAAEKISRGAI